MFVAFSKANPILKGIFLIGSGYKVSPMVLRCFIPHRDRKARVVGSSGMTRVIIVYG
jgi:hypothetical protein